MRPPVAPVEEAVASHVTRSVADLSPGSKAAKLARRIEVPVSTPLLRCPSRHRRRSPNVSIRRSGRLAAKCGARAANATLQAQKVLISKWPTPSNGQAMPTIIAPTVPKDIAQLDRALMEPLDSSKRDALRALFAMEHA